MIEKTYQVTLLNKTGQYKPVSCLVKINQNEDVDLTTSSVEKKKILNKGIEKICVKRYWRSADLKRYGYTNAKVRVYDKEKIEQENKERYERIKQEKYACGEWKAPKKKI